MRLLMCGPFPQKNSFGGIASMMQAYQQNYELFSSYGMDVTFQESLVDYRGVYAGSGKLGLAKSFLASPFFNKLGRSTAPEAVLMHTSRGYALYRDLVHLDSICSGNNAIRCVLIHHVNVFQAFMSPIQTINKRIRALLKSMDLILFLSRSTMDSFIAAGVTSHERCAVVSTFHGYGDETYERVPSDANHILYMGHLFKEKGLEELISAARYFDPQGWVFDVCGTGVSDIENELTRLSKSDQSCISYHGFVGGEKKELLFKKAKVFLLPSYAEGMPISLLEAMHFGCVPVASDVGAIPEVIDGNNGVLIAPRSSKAIIDGIAWAIAGYDVFSKHAVESAKKYTLEGHIRSMSDVLNSRC